MQAAEALNENQLPSKAVSPHSGARPGQSWHRVGSAPRVVAAWLSPRTLFLLALFSLNTWCSYSWDSGLVLEPSHLGASAMSPWGGAQGALGFVPCYGPATSSHHSTALRALEVVKTWLYLFLQLFCGSGCLGARPWG